MNKKLLLAVLLIALVAVAFVFGTRDRGGVSSSSGNGDSEGPIDLKAFVWTGTNQDVLPREVIGKYMEEHKNVSVTITEGSNGVYYPQMVAAHQTTPDDPLFNLAYINTDATHKGLLADMWLPLDKENIPNADLILDEYRQKDGQPGLIWSIGELAILYNTKYVKEPPKSWADIWSNKEYKGHVVLWDNFFYTFLVIAARLNGGDENNIDPAFDVWSKNVDQIHSFVTSLEQMKNLLISGEAWIIPWFVGQGMVWADDGVPVGIAAPKEGIVAVPYYLHVLNGTSDVKKAESEMIINELIKPENVARFAELSYVVPTISGVTLPDKLKDNWFFSEEAVRSAIQFDWAALAANDSDWQVRWAKEVVSKMKK